MKNWNFTKKYTDHKTINSNNYAKFEVNWPRGSQFTARHVKRTDGWTVGHWLRTPWPIYFKLLIVIGIDSLMVCILFGEISVFHSRVMGLYSSNCRRFFVCCAVNWEPLGQFTSNFAQLLELIVFTDFSKNVSYYVIMF
jgi:hypothetical protein